MAGSSSPPLFVQEDASRERYTVLTGKLAGRNFNEEILRQYRTQLKQWRKSTKSKAEELGLLIDQPVQALLHNVQHRFDQTPADPDLKRRANEALRKTMRRMVTAQGRLIESLESSIRETYVYFTTEQDIHSPIAREMKLVYLRVAQMNERQKNRMVYQREELSRSLTQTTRVGDSIIDTMHRKIVNRQTQGSESACETYATEVLQPLEDFATVTQNLLANKDQESTEHLRVRKKLCRHIPEFQRALFEIQAQFPGTEARRVFKKTRLTPNMPIRPSTSQTRREGSRTAAVKHDE